jgi:hypothetical protein
VTDDEPISSSPLSARAIVGGWVTAMICVGGGFALALIIRAIFDWTNDGTARLAFVLATAGFLLGGFRAGLLCPPAPLSNGGIAALLAYIPLGLGQRIIAGKSLNPIGLIFASLLAMSFGIFGGFVANNANKLRARR